MLKQLLKKHTELQNRADAIVKAYVSEKLTIDFYLSEVIEVKKAKKEIKRLTKEYETTREQIYSVEDCIGDIDEDTLQGIVEPLQEYIEDQVHYVIIK